MDRWQEEEIATPSLKRFSKVYLEDISKRGVPLLLCRRGDREYPVMDSVYPFMDYVVHCSIAPDGQPVCEGSMNGSSNVVIQHGAERRRFPYDCEEEPGTLLFNRNEVAFIAEQDTLSRQNVLISGDKVVDMADHIEALSMQDGELCYARENDGCYTLVYGNHSCRVENGGIFGNILLFHSVMLYKPKDQHSNEWICCFQLEVGGHYFVLSSDFAGLDAGWTLKAGGHGIAILGLKVLDGELLYLEKKADAATLVWGEKRIMLDDKFSTPNHRIEHFMFSEERPLLLVKKDGGKTYYVHVGAEESPEYDYILPKSIHFDPKKRVVSFVARFDKSVFRVSKQIG